MERQLVSLIAGVVVCVIIYVFNKIVERASKPTGKTSPKPVASRHIPQIAQFEHQEPVLKSRKVAKNKNKKKAKADMPGDSAVPAIKTKYTYKPHNTDKTATPTDGTMSLRQAVLWSEILKRKF